MTRALRIGAWDTREKSWKNAPHAAITDWLRNHGLPAESIYRIEFYAATTGWARVFTYHRDEKGQRYYNADHTGAAVNEPYDTDLWELPAMELLQWQ